METSSIKYRVICMSFLWSLFSCGGGGSHHGTELAAETQLLVEAKKKAYFTTCYAVLESRMADSIDALMLANAIFFHADSVAAPPRPTAPVSTDITVQADTARVQRVPVKK
jgi:hypothetical protein